MSESNVDQPQLAFEMIVVSVWQALQRVAEADLAGSQLQIGYFELQMPRLAGNNCEQCRSTFQTFERIAEDGVYALRREMRRHVAVSAIGILDSCLADVTRFLLLHEPTCIPPGTRQRRAGETAEEFVEEFVRRKLASPWKKLEFLSKRFDIQLNSGTKEALSRLISQRNVIVHHSGFFRLHLASANGQVWAEKRLFPEVSHEDALEAQMFVRELCDIILVSMCRSLFGEVPRLALMTAEVAAAYRSLREQWAVSRAKRPHVDEFPNPEWTVKQRDGLAWVGDQGDYFIIRPTGLNFMPVLISFLPHKLHGALARAKVDDNELVEFEAGKDKTLLDQMLNGRTLLMEFFDEKNDGPRYARFSLDRFRESWDEACRRTPEVALEDRE